jgi:Flp pilus assembly protein TadG
MIYFPADMVKSRKQDRRSGSAQGFGRRGVATAEFALLTPFLVFLFLGVFEISRGIMMKQMLNDAARRACRTGVLPGKTNSDVTSDVQNILTDNKIAAKAAVITIKIGPGSATDVSGAQPGVDAVTVKVSLPVSTFYWGGIYFLPSSDIESESVTMLKQ